MKLTAVLSLWFAIISAWPAAAAFAPDWESAIDRFSAASVDQGARDRQVHFRQESLGLRDRLRVYEGWARFAEDGQFRWQRLRPTPQVWSFDGDGLVFGEWQPEAWQVHVASGRVARDLAHITSLVSDLSSFLQTHRLALVDRAAGGRHELLILALEPKRRGEFSQLGLVLDGRLGTPHSLEIEFRDGRRTRYFFRQLESLPHDQFAFRFLP